MIFARGFLSPWIAAAGWGALAGCGSSAPTTPYTPITGIDIPSADLVVGRGCGNTGEGQVYRYAAVVAYANDGGGAAQGALASAVFDCFTDGIFSNLPQTDAGNSSFTIAIYGYNQCSFPSALACSPNMAAGACPGENTGTVAQSIASQASTWTATCTATQVAGVTVTAQCSPLEPQAQDADAGSPCGDAGAGDATR